MEHANIQPTEIAGYGQHNDCVINPFSADSSAKKKGSKEKNIVLSRSGSFAFAGTSNFLLRNLPASLFAYVRPSLRTIHIAKEQFLYQQDDKIEYIYFPETAVISEFRMLEDGRMVEVAITGREGAVGLSTLICSSKASNCTQVSQAGYASRIESSVFTKLIKIYPDMTKSLYPYLDSYIRQISQKAICNMYHSVEERFCTWLLMLQDRCGKKNLRLTHEQIARTLGVYRPSVTCIALDMRKKEMIDYSRGGISIRDRKQMEDSACGCYFELGENCHREFAHVN